MRLNEFTLAGAQPSPLQRAAPAQQTSAAPTAQGTAFGDHMVSLANKRKSMDPSDPKAQFIDKLLSTIANYSTDSELEEGIVDTIKGGVQRIKNKVSTTSRALIQRANRTFYNAILERVRALDPQVAADFERLAAQADQALGPVENDPSVRKANQAAIKGIELNTKGDIGKLDADIEKTAKDFAERFDLDIKWARNLIGMFSISVSREDRKKFLEACYNGTALDIDKMLDMGSGPVDAVVTTKIPKVKEVFNSVKSTLLDISLSTGQRGATGPFEAMLAIMGGAVKPGPNEGGDIKLKDGRKFEVKGASLSPSSTLKADGTLPNTGSVSEAWLDSMAMKEIGGSAFRNIANKWLVDSRIKITPAFKSTLWDAMDFKASGIAIMSEAMNYLEQRKKGSTLSFIQYLMSSVFPSVTKIPKYNFVGACQRIVDGIKGKDHRAIAKEQGIMALLEYHKGKGNDGFILFNSSSQTFRTFAGTEGILALANDPNGVSFPTPMTLGKKDRCSPSIYFGPDPTSPEAKEYFRMYNSDPKRVKLRQAAAAAKLI
jgi:hypothetical protein